MKTLYTGKKCQHVDFFNETNYPNVSLYDMGEIKIFLENEGYILKGYNAKQITLDKGSVNGAKSFIDHKSPLFKDVEFYHDNEGVVYIIKR